MSDNLYVGQVPATPMKVTVLHPVTGAGLDLGDYDTIELLMVNPYGEPVDTSGGTIVPDPSEAGVYRYVWPPGSLFTQVGDFKAQTKLIASGVIDYTEKSVIEVHAPLAEV